MHAPGRLLHVVLFLHASVGTGPSFFLLAEEPPPRLHFMRVIGRRLANLMWTYVPQLAQKHSYSGLWTLAQS